MMARDRHIDEEEAALWRAIARDVTPLARRVPGTGRKSVGTTDPGRDAPLSDGKTPPAAPPSAPPVQTAVTPPPPPLPELRTGAPTGLDKRSAQRLRRGQLRPEARLDLHGMTQGEAHTALAGFVRRSRGDGRRCVLVITGKGSVQSGGVLRRMVPRWLNEPALRRHVVAIEHAQARDGGQGALYVLLKRRG